MARNHIATLLWTRGGHPIIMPPVSRMRNKERDLNDLGHTKPHRNGARLRPLEVTVDEGGIERAIRKFTRAVAEDGVLKELKKRRHHVKPGQKRRIKEREAQRRRRKQTRLFRQKDRE